MHVTVLHVCCVGVSRTRTPRRRHAAGLTLIELMIAITLALVVLAALSVMFVANMRARDEVERANQQIENGRYAAQLLSDDLQLAGYWSEFDIWQALAGGMAVPAAKPDPCATTLAAFDAALPLHVQGYDGGAALSCIGGDLRAGTDIVVVRRVSTCILGTANCAEVTGAPYFQASRCSAATELLSLIYTDWYALHTNLANLNKQQGDCATVADRRRFMTHVYFVANNDRSGDGIPTLKRAELRGMSFRIESLAHGIEDLQFEYGIDTTAAPGDGNPDTYTADPDTFAAPDGLCPGTPAACVSNWVNTVAVKVHILARATTRTVGYVDDKTYTLGLSADGTDNTVGPFSDDYKRHLFQTVVRLNNVAGRRQ